MNKYEVMVIVEPAEEETTNAVIEKVEALIARVGGTVEKVDRWGKRRLAYAVKNSLTVSTYWLTLKQILQKSKKSIVY